MMLNSNKFFTYDVVSCSFLFDICTSYIFAKTLNFEVISQEVNEGNTAVVGFHLICNMPIFSISIF